MMKDTIQPPADPQAWIVPFDATEAPLDRVGGKGANLVRLYNAGLPVPAGFIVATDAYRAYVAENQLGHWLSQALVNLPVADLAQLALVSERIRKRFTVERVAPALHRTLRSAYLVMNECPVAVRSSATTEDLPDHSFAGQHDTFLNVIGDEGLVTAVVNCWSSLWTARALAYRQRNGIDHLKAAVAVVVQEMAPSQASGVLFTANPLTGKRDEMVVDATVGLGEALVSGQVTPDQFTLDTTGTILAQTVGEKEVTIRPREGGGVETVPTTAGDRAAIPPAALRRLAELGQQIAALYGEPQDVEWAWDGEQVAVLQARPITSLFPLPTRNGRPIPAQPLPVYMSFGSVQGMLDPITPLGRDILKSLFVAGAGFFGVERTLETLGLTADAAERLWLDLGPAIRHQRARAVVLRALPLVDPVAARALAQLLEEAALRPQGRAGAGWAIARALRRFLPLLRRAGGNWRRPDAARTGLDQWLSAHFAVLDGRHEAAQTPAEQVAALRRSVDQLFPLAISQVLPVLLPGLVGLRLAMHLAGEVADSGVAPLTLTRGLAHNVTTEMDLLLWQTAEKIRNDEMAFQTLQLGSAADLADAYQREALPPGLQTAIAAFLARYGRRGVAEIDFGRPRWQDDPAPIFQTLQSYVRIDDPALAPTVIFERGAAEAEAALPALQAALRRRRGGRIKAWLLGAAVRRLWALGGVRETPKFFVVNSLGAIRAGLMRAGAQLVDEGHIERADDLFFLSLPELEALVAGEAADWRARVAESRWQYEQERERSPLPILLLGDGRVFFGAPPTDAPADALVGTPVSPGSATGPVRIVHNPHADEFTPGDILVCRGTDPAWTPLFLTAAGLVMEVGGLMTHGSVVAREYGIPAVVGVSEATTRLRNGQRIIVDGSSGLIRLIDD